MTIEGGSPAMTSIFFSYLKISSPCNSHSLDCISANIEINDKSESDF